jgi:hypothetical protein
MGFVNLLKYSHNRKGWQRMSGRVAKRRVAKSEAKAKKEYKAKKSKTT